MQSYVITKTYTVTQQCVVNAESSSPEEALELAKSENNPFEWGTEYDYKLVNIEIDTVEHGEDTCNDF